MPTSVQSAGAPGRRLGVPKRGVRRIEKRGQGKGPTKTKTKNLKKRPEWDVSSYIKFFSHLFYVVNV